MRSRSSLKSGPGWPACPTATSAGSTSSSACSPSTPRTSASPPPDTSAGRSGNCGSTCCASRPGVTYWLAPGRRVILLTVFRKSRSAETAEVTRALRAQMICETQHSQAHDIFDREVD